MAKQKIKVFRQIQGWELLLLTLGSNRCQLSGLQVEQVLGGPLDVWKLQDPLKGIFVLHSLSEHTFLCIFVVPWFQSPLYIRTI